MKFLFLSSYAHLVLDPKSDRVSGGAELQIALLARELAKRGHEAVIVGGDIGQPDGQIFDGVRTRNGGKFHTGGMLEMLGALPRVTQILREEKPDFAFVLGWTAWLFLLWLLKFPIGYRLGFICGLDTEVNGEFRRAWPLRGALFEFGMRHGDVRFAMTKLQERLFRENGMNCGLYRNLILPRSKPRTAEKTVDLLWVARCQPIKRPHLFLDLVEQFPERKCQMICPREDVELWESVKARADTLPNLEFIERVPYHEIQTRYDAAKCFVNTSTYEGWPNSFIQSGLGAAAILSLSVQPDTLFTDYALGFFANHDFSAMVQWLRGNPPLEAMGNEAERFVRELHDNEKETTAFLGGLTK